MSEETQAGADSVSLRNYWSIEKNAVYYEEYFYNYDEEETYIY